MLDFRDGEAYDLSFGQLLQLSRIEKFHRFWLEFSLVGPAGSITIISGDSHRIEDLLRNDLSKDFFLN